MVWPTAITFSSTAPEGSLTIGRRLRDDQGLVRQKALLLIRSSAATACYGGITSGSGSCCVQVVDGAPAAPGEFPFDNNNANTGSTRYEAHAM